MLEGVTCLNGLIVYLVQALLYERMGGVLQIIDIGHSIFREKGLVQL